MRYNQCSLSGTAPVNVSFANESSCQASLSDWDSTRCNLRPSLQLIARPCHRHLLKGLFSLLIYLKDIRDHYVITTRLIHTLFCRSYLMNKIQCKHRPTMCYKFLYHYQKLTLQSIGANDFSIFISSFKFTRRPEQK